MIHRELNLLRPSTQNLCEAFLDGCAFSEVLKNAGYKVILLETIREPLVQVAYWCRGRLHPTTGDLIDSAKAVRRIFEMAGLWKLSDQEARTPNTWTLYSKHLDGTAFDAAPSKDGENPDWKAPLAVWEEMHRIGREVGLRCGADFPGGKIDRPHYEAP